jgi:hypothetical protein
VRGVSDLERGCWRVGWLTGNSEGYNIVNLVVGIEDFLDIWVTYLCYMCDIRRSRGVILACPS